ncbi:MAG: hypothetical protein ACXABD_00410 [Candidatus Thorarchaeota archaeon]|jgi:hypothetical protein
MYIGNIEIFDPNRYSHDETSSPGIEYNWMVVWCSMIDYERSQSPDHYVIDLINTSRSIAHFNRYNLLNSTFTRIPPDQERSGYIPHIANGEQVFRHPSYFSPQILDVEILPGGECIGIPRGTFWLKIFQRKIKNILKKREQKVRHFRCIKNFMSRELGVSTRISAF